jgi:hypothetical protein
MTIILGWLLLPVHLLLVLLSTIAVGIWRLVSNFYAVAILSLVLLALLCMACGAQAQAVRHVATVAAVSPAATMSTKTSWPMPTTAAAVTYIYPSNSGIHLAIDLGTTRDVIQWSRSRMLPALHITRKGGK